MSVYTPPPGGFYYGPKLQIYRCGSCAAILFSATWAWVHDWLEHS